MLLTEWQEALKEQSRQKEMNANVIKHQRIVVKEAVDASACFFHSRSFPRDRSISTLHTLGLRLSQNSCIR